MNRFSIAIDGPAGAGKSTIAKLIAKELGIIYVDTGAMYRAFALHCLRNNISCDRITNDIIDNIDIQIKHVKKEQNIFLNGENVNPYIRTAAVSDMASNISAIPEVRLKLVELQRNLAKNDSIVMDGRDIGTYVLPDATIKVFLTASVDIRAERRWLELKEKGINSDLETIKEEIRIRDHRDMNREFAPLKKADDAIEIDSTSMSINDVVKTVINELRTTPNIT